MLGRLLVDGVEQDARVDDASPRRRALEGIQSVGDIRHVDPEAELRGALAQAPLGRTWQQSSVDELVHGLGDTQTALAAQLLDGADCLSIELHCRTHA